MESNPYLPPSTEMGFQAQPDLVLASRSQRLGAVFLDGLVYILCAIPLLFMFVMGEDFMTVLIALSGFIYLLILATNAYFVIQNAQSIGKKFVGIKVVRENGENASFWRIVLHRNLFIIILSMIPFVGWLISLVDPLLIFRENHKCLHDEIASTNVVVA